jgi:hypothetical protein
VAGERRDKARYRAPDSFVAARARRPLSVSSERIAGIAWRAAGVLTGLEERIAEDVDRETQQQTGGSMSDRTSVLVAPHRAAASGRCRRGSRQRSHTWFTPPGASTRFGTLIEDR